MWADWDGGEKSVAGVWVWGQFEGIDGETGDRDGIECAVHPLARSPLTNPLTRLSLPPFLSRTLLSGWPNRA